MFELTGLQQDINGCLYQVSPTPNIGPDIISDEAQLFISLQL